MPATGGPPPTRASRLNDPASAVIFEPAAVVDLDAIHDRIENAASNAAAARFIDRIEAFCFRLDIASERGMLRAEILPGLRTIEFEGRLTIAFVVDANSVRILRLFAAGRDWESDFG